MTGAVFFIALIVFGLIKALATGTKDAFNEVFLKDR